MIILPNIYIIPDPSSPAPRPLSPRPLNPRSPAPLSPYPRSPVHPPGRGFARCAFLTKRTYSKQLGMTIQTLKHFFKNNAYDPVITIFKVAPSARQKPNKKICIIFVIRYIFPIYDMIFFSLNWSAKPMRFYSTLLNVTFMTKEEKRRSRGVGVILGLTFPHWTSSRCSLTWGETGEQGEKTWFCL